MASERRVAIVTAGGRGIGRAIAMRLGRDGYAVVASDIDDSGAGVAEEIEAAGGVAAAKAANVAQADEVAALVAFALERFGRLDAAVNNAGVGAMPKLLGEVTVAEWARAVDVTLTGTFLSMRAELNHFAQAGAGSVVNIASIAAINATPRLTPYGAAKHGVRSLTESAAVEYAPLGIRVNAIAPGPIDTRALASLPDEERAAQAAKVPMRKIGRPEDIAAAASWLLSEEAAFVTGVVLPVDGGAQHVP